MDERKIILKNYFRELEIVMEDLEASLTRLPLPKNSKNLTELQTSLIIYVRLFGAKEIIKLIENMIRPQFTEDELLSLKSFEKIFKESIIKK